MLKILLNPFEKYSEKHLLFFGLLCLFIGSYLGYLLNVHFDRILHLSYVENTFLMKPLLQNILITFLLTIALYALGKYCNKKTRLIDILTTSLIARVPFYFLTLFNIKNRNKIIIDKLIKNIEHIQDVTFSTSETIFLFVSTIVGIVILIWFAILIWNGFKTATNAKTTKEIILFISTLFIANLFSFYILQLIN